MTENKNIVIWVAGKIGRGFIAELFFAENYQITFVDQSESLINELNRYRAYFNADRVDKYKNFELVQHLRDKFIGEYGSIACKDIHCHKYGGPFDLTKKVEAELFEKAGAHGEKGETEVVANAAKWTIEILTDEFAKN